MRTTKYDCILQKLYDAVDEDAPRAILKHDYDLSIKLDYEIEPRIMSMAHEKSKLFTIFKPVWTRIMQPLTI